MPEPLVIQVMNRHRAGILAHDADQERAMADAWLAVERALESQTELLARELMDERRAGRAHSVAKVQRMARYQELLAQLAEQMDLYNLDAETMIREAQALMAQLGLDNAAEAIMASYTDTMAPFFARLPVAQMTNMVGLAGNGSPLRDLLDGAYGDASTGMTKALIQGTALGWNPNRTAKAMRAGVATGLGRVRTIARTEQIRVYREAGRQQYQASGVVEGFVRICAKQTRTCMACLAADGEWYELAEMLRDHPNGRCAMVPKVVGMRLPQFERGVDWFRAQAPADQLKMMGPGVFAAWQEKKFDFGQLAVRTTSDVWGDGVRPANLAELGIAA